MPYLLPQDGYDSYLSAPLTDSATEVFVNELPTKTAGVLTVYEQDGRTIREKIYYTGTSASPNKLTGVVRGLRLSDSAGQVLFTAGSGLNKEHPSGARVAMTDNINYLGLTLAVINGDMETGGIMKNPASRVISNSRHVVDKEYADAIGGAGNVTSLLVTKNGADPTLTVNVATGYFIKNDQMIGAFAGASAQAVTPSQTNYIELIPTGSGSIAVNTSGFTTGRIPLAIAIANGSTITSLSDARGFFTMHDGVIDKVRTWGTVQSFAADNLQVTSDADSSNDAVRKSLLDSTALARSTENAATGTSGEAIAVRDALYVKASDGKLYKTDADADESTYSFVGFALQAATGADETIRYAKPGGIVTGLTGLTAGNYYFLSGTAGAIANTPHATRLAKVAQALSSTSLRVIEPKFIRVGTIAITGTGDTVVTTGFYPGKIRIEAARTSEAQPGQMSVGDDSNTCAYVGYDGTNNIGGHATNLAFKIRTGSSGARSEGTISAKSQTGFTANCSVFSQNITLRYMAESL